jgi:hypothetical protein
MCKRVGETVDQLLIHCPVGWELWTMVFFSIREVMLKGIVDLLSSWQGKFDCCQNVEIWSYPPLSHVGEFGGSEVQGRLKGRNIRSLI